MSSFEPFIKNFVISLVKMQRI